MNFVKIDCPYELLSDSKLEKLAYLQTLCWGAFPFWEFSFCDACKRVHSLEEICGERNTFSPDMKYDMSCKNCWKETDLIYFNEDFIQEILDYFRFNICLILWFSDTWEICGFWLMVKKKIWELLGYEFATRPWSYEEKEIYQKTQLSPEEEILCLQQIYISPQNRWNGFAFQMLRELFSHFTNDRDTKIVLETHFQSEFYAISRGLWFTDIIHDPYGYVFQKNDSAQAVASILWKNREVNLLSWEEIERYRFEGAQICSENPGFLGSKFYF